MADDPRAQAYAGIVASPQYQRWLRRMAMRPPPLSKTRRKRTQRLERRAVVRLARVGVIDG